MRSRLAQGAAGNMVDTVGSLRKKRNDVSNLKWGVGVANCTHEGVKQKEKKSNAPGRNRTDDRCMSVCTTSAAPYHLATRADAVEIHFVKIVYSAQCTPIRFQGYRNIPRAWPCLALFSHLVARFLSFSHDHISLRPSCDG